MTNIEFFKHILEEFEKIENKENSRNSFLIYVVAMDLIEELNGQGYNDGVINQLKQFIVAERDFYMALSDYAVDYDVECFVNACESLDGAGPKEYESLLFETIEKAVKNVVKERYCVDQLNEIVKRCTAILNEYKNKEVV